MKTISKYISLFLVTVVLGTVLVGVVLLPKTSPVKFVIKSDFCDKEIYIYDSEDNNCYVFLPSYADMEDIVVKIPRGQMVYLGDTQLLDEANCGQFELETPYRFRDSLRQNSTLWFYKSENIATIYIDTLSGNMDHLHLDKNVEEHAAIEVYASDGQLSQKDNNAVITGRGNTTWDYNKKPYLLKLSSELDLLEMGKATDWVLLANAADGSNLNNKIVYSVANRVGFDWSPECEYVDVYLNGEYNGLYLLSERVQVSENRLELDNSSDFLGEFVLSIDDETIYSTQTQSGRYVSVLEPRAVDDKRASEISSTINLLEQELLSDRDLSTSDIIDLDSWVLRYILDEISANVDSDRGSCYFYYSNGKFYAGPIWDYDKGFGDCQQSRNPKSFVANNSSRSSAYELPYYSKLCKNTSFQKRVKELYQDRVLPIIMDVIEQEIDVYSEQISSSSKSDELRWQGKTPEITSAALIRTDIESVRDFLKLRIEFLNSAWIDGKDYCTVQMELAIGAEYTNYAVEKGQKFETDMVDLANTTWYIKATGEKFDPSKPISEDIILVKQLTSAQTQLQAENTTGRDLREYITYASIFGIAAFLIFLVAVDIYRRRRERVK